MTIIPGSIQLVENPKAKRDESYANGVRETILGGAAFDFAKQEITSWNGYQKTRLCELPGLARALKVKNIFYKDEGSRFNLGSFKALGGAYAVLRLLQKEIETKTGQVVRSKAIVDRSFADIVSGITVTCATDGNHGRSVAWGASLFGCKCVIYVHETVSKGRQDAIAKYGAEVRVVPGNYDDAVRKAAQDAAENGWFVVSDTSYEGYTSVPRDVMQGYTVMAEESVEQIGEKPTHIFVQGGVGGLAAAICAYFWEQQGAARPYYVVVEPDRADCLYQSAKAGKPVAVHGALDTIMAGLACGEVSIIAWEILSRGANAFMTIPDSAAAEAMRVLASAPYGDDPIVAGESAVAGLAGAILAASDADARARLGLTEDSVLLFYGTEGATDAAVYKQIVGRTPEDILAVA